MINLEKVLIPTSTGDGGGELIYNSSGTLTRYEHGNIVNVYLFHETSDSGDIYAVELEMPYPMTRAKCINAAEMKAYSLENAMDVASFASSLARKQRLGEDLDEVTEHDEFIQSIKEELTKLEIL